ncbi:MAG: helix-turn-helix domain-containing protein [Acidobacteriota bacterium]
MPTSPAHPTIALDHYILDTLLRDLTGHDRKPAAFLVYLWLAAEQSRTRHPVAISFQTLAENTGLSRSSTQASVRWLLKRKLLTATKANATAIPTYTVEHPWRRRP